MPQERGPAPAVAVADPQAATAMLDTSSLVFPQSDPSIGPHADEEVFRDEEPAPPLPEAAPPAPKARERPPPPLPAPREHVGEEATRAPAPTMARGKGATLSLAGVALALATAAWCLWAWVGHGEAPKAEATAEGLLVAPVPTTRERDASAALPAAMPQPVPDEPSPAPEEPAPLQEPAATTAAAIRSDASGTVEVVLCEVGGEVTAGTPLLRVVDSAPRSQRKLAALRREERAFREAAESGDVRAKRELAAIRGELAGLEAARRVHVVTAPYAGRVVALQVAVGDAVTRGATVLTLEPAEESR